MRGKTKERNTQINMAKNHRKWIKIDRPLMEESGNEGKRSNWVEEMFVCLMCHPTWRGIRVQGRQKTNIGLQWVLEKPTDTISIINKIEALLCWAAWLYVGTITCMNTVPGNLWTINVMVQIDHPCTYIYVNIQNLYACTQESIFSDRFTAHCNPCDLNNVYFVVLSFCLLCEHKDMPL